MTDFPLDDLISTRLGPDSTELDLSQLHLAAFPGLANYPRLTHLNLSCNNLVEIPPEVFSLPKLQQLDLSQNCITEIPDEIGHLQNLEELYLSANPLKRLSPQLAQLRNLQVLDLHDVETTVFPPPEIASQGTEAILEYLTDTEKEPQWISKLLVVGEGGVGKTSILKALKGEPHDPRQPTTHGLGVVPLPLPHPKRRSETMLLNCWDFGGQQIYHATHQFFLTDRSLFLLLWNARLGWEQGRLYYWLDLIQARAPNAPVILVATHCDERLPELPSVELRSRYSQIADTYSVSNATRDGIDGLRRRVQAEAANLPLMGAEWPLMWIRAANEVRKSSARYLEESDFRALVQRHGLRAQGSIDRFSTALHELGDILYFKDDAAIRDVVIIKPQWVTEYIARILDSEAVADAKGVLTSAHMMELWNDVSPTLRQHFLRLMERFDLSYRTLEDREVSLVVEKLPLDPPAIDVARALRVEAGGAKEIQLHYELSTLPPGIPSWFIARSHRFTRYMHWRHGALLERGDADHQALVRADYQKRTIDLIVRGSYPQEFFALLRDGLELTLARFPGLDINRYVPCVCRDGSHDDVCRHKFVYEDLRRRLTVDPPRVSIECPVSFSDLDVRELLLGLQRSEAETVASAIGHLRSEVNSLDASTSSQIAAMQSHMQREFLLAWRREQARIESRCPTIFTVVPHKRKLLPEVVFGRVLELRLYCEAPGSWHAVDGPPYIFDRPAQWWSTLAPYVTRLLEVLKYAVPFVAPIAGIVSEQEYKAMQHDIKLMEQVVNVMPSRVGTAGDLFNDYKYAQSYYGDRSISDARLLYHWLTQLDPDQRWGSLRPLVTPEGASYWLCDAHYRELAY